MHPTRSQQSIINELSSHASLLLSASPTIINSPLQTNTNNTSAPTNNTNNINTNLSLSMNFSDDELPEDNINFRKPQNEIFKKLDGKIQKIVAAHSNLNKLYALNDFSSSVPRKPFELPPQLPRPPPWVPKVSSDYGCSQWAEETLNNLNRTAPLDLDDNFRQVSSIPGPQRVTRIVNCQPETRDDGSPPPAKLSIDSAISRLHQRRQQQLQQGTHRAQIQLARPSLQTQQKFQVPQPQPRISQQAQRIHQLNLKPVQNNTQNAARKLFPGSSRGPNNNITQISSKDLGALNALIKAQKHQQLQQQLQTQQHIGESSGPTSIPPNLTPEERRKFQVELINIFRQEIAAVTKLAKLKFQSPQSKEGPGIADQKSLLLKKSPQSLFNTIRRETSLLLNRREPAIQKTGSSLLSEQKPVQIRTQQPQQNYSHELEAAFKTVNRNQTISRHHHTIKVVVPPSEHFKHVCGKQPGSSDLYCNCFESKAQKLELDEWCPPRKFTLKYRNLQMKLYQLKFIQKKDELNRKRGISISILPADARKRLANPQKSLDKIVDRLQAKCMSSTSSSPVNQGSSNQSPSPTLDTARSSQKEEISLSPPQSPRAIPVFRTSPNKDGTSGNQNLSSAAARALKAAKKAKRLHHHGLRLGNYMEKDSSQPNTERITVEQFAKCLNLVRTNDAALRRCQEKLMQSETIRTVQTHDRSLRLRRLRGERMRMPASASYRATRQVGLQ